MRAFNISGSSTNSNVISFCITPSTPSISLISSNLATPILGSSALSGNQWFLDGAAIPGAISNTLSIAAAGIYTVQTTTADGCASAVSVNFPVIVTGDIALSQSITLYPNPSRDYVFITGIEDQAPVSSVIDMIGKCTSLKLERLNDLLRGDVSNLSTGMYILRIDDGTQIHQFKFIKQ